MFLDLVRNAAFYSMAALYCWCAFIPLMLLLYIPHSWPFVKTLYCWILKISSKFLLFSTFLSVTYQGFDRLPQGPVVFIANHQSVLDIFLVENVVGSYPCFWVTKSDLLDYPILKQIAFRSFIPVPLKTSSEVQQESVVALAIAKIKLGYSVVLFPEGGRFVDGSIHTFYSGFAAIAKETGVPVVPLFISGTGFALPSKARMIRRSPVMITIGTSFVCEKEESVISFKNRVFNWFVELNWRREYLLDHFGIRLCKNTYEIPALEENT